MFTLLYIEGVNWKHTGECKTKPIIRAKNDFTAAEKLRMRNVAASALLLVSL